MNKTDKIYVAGHRGLVGSAIVRNLEQKGYSNIIGRDPSRAGSYKPAGSAGVF